MIVSNWLPPPVARHSGYLRSCQPADGSPGAGNYLLFSRSPRRRESRIPAGQERSVADNFLQKKQKQQKKAKKAKTAKTAKTAGPV
jgi:hypothetical protein